MVEWYTKDPWKAYISWFSPRWAMPRDEFDPKEWADKLQRGGFRVAVMHTKHHDGVCFFRSKYREVQPERDFVGEFVAEAHKRGMYVVAYYSTTPDAWSAQEHPEWCCVKKDGSLVELEWSPFSVGVCCINNPGYRAFLLGQLEELQHNCHTDGFWMDTFWQQAQPFWLQSQCCFCYHCRNKYAKDSGGKKLEDMAGTDEVELWYRDSFLSLLKDIKKIASHDGIERVVTYNLAGLGRALGYEAIDDECNILVANAGTPASSFFSRLLEHTGKPFEIYCPVAVSVDCWTFRPTNFLILQAAIVAAHGGSFLGGFDVKPSGYISGYQMDQLGEVAKYIRDRQEFLINTKPLYDVGLLTPPNMERELSRRGGWTTNLLRNQIPFAVLPPETTDFSPYRLVIIDEEFPMNEGFVGKLEEYVANGGNIIVVHSAAGVMREDGEGFMLSKLLGVECCGLTNFENHYLGGIDECIASNLGGDPVRADGKTWKLKLTTAEALVYYVYPIARWSRERCLWSGPNPPGKEISRDPAITVNHFGRGKAAYIGCPLGKDEENPHRREFIQLSLNLVSLLVEEPLLRAETPFAVEVVVNHQQNRYIVHLLNHYVDMSYLYGKRHSVPKLANVSVWINENRIGPVKKIIRVPDNQEMKVERDGSWVHLVASELGIQEIFVLEH